jgi:hypothetical protein
LSAQFYQRLQKKEKGEKKEMISGLDERKYRNPVEARAASIVEEVDEAVGHTTDLDKFELMNACYLEIGKLLGRWAQKIDKIEKRSDRHPTWVTNYAKKKELETKQAFPQLSTGTVGFKLENIFYGEDHEGNLSDDLILLSEPFSMWMEDFDELVQYCKKNDLDFYVDGFNRHLPGRCFRVAIFRPKSEGRRFSRASIRVQELVAHRVFRELSKADSIDEEAFVEALVRTNEFDHGSARKIVKKLVDSGQIPSSKILK